MPPSPEVEFTDVIVTGVDDEDIDAEASALPPAAPVLAAKDIPLRSGRVVPRGAAGTLHDIVLEVEFDWCVADLSRGDVTLV